MDSIDIKHLLHFAFLLSLGAGILTVLGDPSNLHKEEDATDSEGRSAVEKRDSLIVSKFESVTDLKAPDWQKFMEAMGIDSDHRDSIRNGHHIRLEIQKQPTSYRLTYKVGSYFEVMGFTLGKEIWGWSPQTDKYFTGNITFEGNKLITDWKNDDVNCHHEGEFSKKGIKAILKCNGAAAKLDFKRIQK